MEFFNIKDIRTSKSKLRFRTKDVNSLDQLSEELSVNFATFKINSAPSSSSKLTYSVDGRGNKSIGARGRKPYTIFKGHT